MNKSRRILGLVSTILLIMLSLGFGALSVYHLRQNNLKMLELREAVFEADKNNGNTAKALSDLQVFVVSHMNTSLPKLGKEKAVQLKYTYERVVKAEQERVSAEREKLNLEATQYCQTTFASASFAVRAQCVQDYFASHPITELNIPKEPYGYDFVTPLWTSDAAGLSLLAAAICLLVLILRIISWFMVRHSIKSRV